MPPVFTQLFAQRLDAKSKEIVMEAMAECSALQVKLAEDANIQLLGEFRANKTLTVSEVDLAAFRKQTAPVLDKWIKEKPFGAFVQNLRKTVLE